MTSALPKIDPPDTKMSAVRTEGAARADCPITKITMQWNALHDAAAALGIMADLQPEMPSRKVRDFPALIKKVGGWKLDLARDGVADLTAMMQPGLTALLAASTRGQNPATAALALWHEFHNARSAVLKLAPDPLSEDIPESQSKI